LLEGGFTPHASDVLPRIEQILHEQRQAGQLTAVEIDGSRKRGERLGYFTAPLVDETWGALQRRPDDCLRAGIATFLQTPAHTVPDLRLGELTAAGSDPEQMDRIIGRVTGGWLEKNAITLRAHATKLPVTSKRWVGVVGGEDDESTSHCVLMQGREVIFDTAWLLPLRKNEPLSWNSLDDVSFGLTIERR
jgi:hypothetical protein